MNPFDEKVRRSLGDEIMEPDTLHTLEERVLARYRGTRRKKAAQLFLMMSLLFSGLLFYTANTESVFADKLRSVPILKEFLTAMDISPAEEKSVEELGILSESGKYDVRLQYALSEDKRVFLYFQFPEEVVLREKDHLEIELLDVYDQVTKKDYSMTFMKNLNPGMPPSNNGYLVIQGFIPAGMDLSFPEKLHIAFRANVARNVSYDHWGTRSAEDEPLGEYRFDVELQKMEKRILERVGKKVLIDGNTLVIDQLERGLKTLDIVVSQPKNNIDIINAPNTPLSRPPLGFPTRPEDLVVDEFGNPLRIDKAYSWEVPIASHGLMHMVITNATNHDPYAIDTLILFMANMAWNSTMNTSAVRKMLVDKEEDGEYKIPFIVVCDAFHSETTAFADLILPDTTYLERHDVMSMLDRPISEFDGPVDSVRIPVIPPTGECKPFQEVLIELASRLKFPAFTNEDGSRKFKDYPDFVVPLARAVRSATALPADYLSLPDVGRLAAGHRADLVVLDDALVASRVMHAGAWV